MKLNYVPTIGGNLFYMGDAEDENAPMLDLRFHNEFANLPAGLKAEIAQRVLLLATTWIMEALEGEEPIEPSAPCSPEAAAVVNSIIEAKVPEENFLRDALEEL